METQCASGATAALCGLSSTSALLWQQPPAAELSSPEKHLKDAAHFKKLYTDHVQFVFSRRQHHGHRKDKKTGVRMPQNACKSKHCKEGEWRQKFPKEKQINTTMKIIGTGIARNYGLRCSGRRNTLGAILNKRNCAWIAGIAPAFAAFFRSNTNIIPHYSVPALR